MSARAARRRRIPRALLPALALWLCAGASAVPPVRAAGASDRPVLVTGAALGTLLGEPIGSLRLLRWRDGAFVAVPFQIDPRERRARPGRRARRLYVPPPAGGRSFPESRRLAPDDELVFMRADLGPAPPPGARPPGSRSAVLIELEGGPTAVLAAFDAPPPLSSRRYVRAEEAGRRVEARSYTLAFSEARPGVLDVLRLHPPGPGARGAPGPSGAAPDILDRVKIRIRGTLLHAFPFRRDENDIDTRVDGVRSGPVRVLRLCRHRLRLVAGLRSPWVEEAQIFYPDGFAFPVWLAKSPATGRLLTRLAFRVGPDWSPAALGMRIRAAGWTTSHPVDGRMDAGERAPGTGRDAWSVLFGEDAALVSGIEAEGGAAPAIDIGMRYRDDLTRKDGPEDHRGEIGALAFTFSGAARLPAGAHQWTVRTGVVARYVPGEERALVSALAPEAPRRVIPLSGSPARTRPRGGEVP